MKPRAADSDMMQSRRRDPTKPGLAGLTDEHHRAWKEHRLTLDDIAAQLGVSKMAVSKRFRRRGRDEALPEAPDSSVARSLSPKSLPPKPPLPGAKGIVHEFTEENVRAIAGSAAFGILCRANFLVVSELELGASQVKATATAISAALDTLARLGIVTFTLRDTLPTELRVQVLTADEEANIRRQRASEAPS